MHAVRTFTLVVASVAGMAACGGGGGSTPAPQQPPPQAPTTSPPPATGTPLAAARVVRVESGQAIADINIAVASPASPTLNAENLGVAELSGTGTAFNTGGTVSRGSTRRIILFGSKLTGELRVAISGPNDITVSNIRSITSTNDKPGLAFEVSVRPDAALGARTIFLTAANNDVTAFAGGLEVVP